MIVTFHPNPLPVVHNKLLHRFFKNYSYSQYFGKNSNMKALVHNDLTKKMYVKSGFDPDSVITIFMPTPNLLEEYPEKNMALKDKISHKLDLDENSICLSLVGLFINIKDMMI